MENTVQKWPNITFNEIIIIIALVFSPFTALRFSFFGVAETLFVLYCGIYIYDNKGILQIPTESSGKYYVVFIITTIVGWAFNIISGINSGTTGSAIFNLSSYIITGITILCFECSIKDEKVIVRPNVILKWLFILFGIISVILYILSLTRSSILGFPLRYYKYFSPLANNIHQYAMFALPLSFVGFYYAYNEESTYKKAFFIILSLSYVYMNYSTGSEKALIGLVVGTIVFVITYLIGLVSDSYQRKFLIIVLVILLTIIVVLNYDTIVLFFINYFVKIDNSGSRQHLYLSAVRIILNKSPIIGLGPSVHVRLTSGELYDSHETFLAAGLSGGIIGVYYITRFLTTTTKRVMKNPHLLAAIIPIYIYALGGDLLRKLSVWIVFILISYIEKEEQIRELDNISECAYIK